MAPDDRVSQAPGGPKGANRHAERAEEAQVPAGRLAVFEDAFGKVTRVAAKKKTSGYNYASEDDILPCFS